MENDQAKITVQLTPLQYEALSALSLKENCEISSLVVRGVDTFIATYGSDRGLSSVEAKLDTMNEQIVKLLISTMKLVAQTLYFSKLPLVAGPVKARLNAEGVSIQWHQSKQFAIDLLSPPTRINSQDDNIS